MRGGKHHESHHTIALARQKRGQRINVVFISRRSTDLWDRIGRADTDIRDLVSHDGMRPHELPAVGTDETMRQKLFRDAYGAFESHFGESRALTEQPDLSEPAFEEILLIHMAALALYRRQLATDTLSEEALLAWILDRERRCWDELLRERGMAEALTGPVIEQAAGYLTLITLGEGIVSRQETIEHLSRCPLLDGQSAADLNGVAGVFHDLYPGPGWVNGVTPDLLGIYFLSATDDEFVTDAFASIEPA